MKNMRSSACNRVQFPIPSSVSPARCCVDRFHQCYSVPAVAPPAEHKDLVYVVGMDDREELRSASDDLLVAGEAESEEVIGCFGAYSTRDHPPDWIVSSNVAECELRVIY